MFHPVDQRCQALPQGRLPVDLSSRPCSRAGQSTIGGLSLICLREGVLVDHHCPPLSGTSGFPSRKSRSQTSPAGRALRRLVCPFGVDAGFPRDAGQRLILSLAIDVALGLSPRVSFRHVVCSCVLGVGLVPKWICFECVWWKLPAKPQKIRPT